VAKGLSSRGGNNDFGFSGLLGEDIQKSAASHFDAGYEQVSGDAGRSFGQVKDRGPHCCLVMQTRWIVIKKNIQCPGAYIQKQESAHFMDSNLMKWNAEGTPQTDAGVEPALAKFQREI
jgi:hypothetical protein